MEAVAVYRERYHKVGIFECSLYPGVKECIEELKKTGIYDRDGIIKAGRIMQAYT